MSVTTDDTQNKCESKNFCYSVCINKTAYLHAQRLAHAQ